MFLLTLKDNKEDGAYAVQDQYGNKVLFLFEEEDDADRYAMMLEDQEETEMDVVEVDDELAIKTCKHYNYKYAVITPDDIVIPPKLNDNLSRRFDIKTFSHLGTSLRRLISKTSYQSSHWNKRCWKIHNVGCTYICSF
jgi:hypothetical protein